MNKSAVPRAISTTSPVTKPVTGSVTAVIAAQKLVRNSPAYRDAVEIARFAVKLALDIDARDFVRIGPSGFRTLWPETKAERFIDRAPERPRVRPSALSSEEMQMRDAVLSAMLTAFRGKSFAGAVILMRAMDYEWEDVRKFDVKRRKRRMLQYIEEDGLYRLWCALTLDLQSLLRRLHIF